MVLNIDRGYVAYDFDGSVRLDAAHKFYKMVGFVERYRGVVTVSSVVEFFNLVHVADENKLRTSRDRTPSRFADVYGANDEAGLFDLLLLRLLGGRRRVLAEEGDGWQDSLHLGRRRRQGEQHWIVRLCFHRILWCRHRVVRWNHSLVLRRDENLLVGVVIVVAVVANIGVGERPVSLIFLLVRVHDGVVGWI